MKKNELIWLRNILRERNWKPSHNYSTHNQPFTSCVPGEISMSPSIQLIAAAIQCLRCFCRIFCKAQRQLCTKIHQDQQFLKFWVWTKSGTNSAAACKVPKVRSHALILSSSHRLCRPRRVILPVPLRHSAQSRCRLTSGLEGMFFLKRKHRNSLHSPSLCFPPCLGLLPRNLHPLDAPKCLDSSWCRIVPVNSEQHSVPTPARN